MVMARLLVERGSLRDQTEDWGHYHFLALPSPADRIAVRRGGETHYLTVLSTHHAPVAVDARGPSDAETDNAPKASVVAKWTGSG